jgi:hypothetical protein
MILDKLEIGLVNSTIEFTEGYTIQTLQQLTVVKILKYQQHLMSLAHFLRIWHILLLLYVQSIFKSFQ